MSALPEVYQQRESAATLWSAKESKRKGNRARFHPNPRDRDGTSRVPFVNPLYVYDQSDPKAARLTITYHDLWGDKYVSMRAFRNSDKQSISELKLAKDIIFKLIEKRLFSRFCSLYPSVFCGSPKSFLGVTKWPLSIFDYTLDHRWVSIFVRMPFHKKFPLDLKEKNDQKEQQAVKLSAPVPRTSI